MSLVDEVRYDAAYMFQYSRRPGTVASDMNAQVQSRRPGAVRTARRTAGEISLERNEALVGTTVELTIERSSSKPTRPGPRAARAQQARARRRR